MRRNYTIVNEKQNRQAKMVLNRINKEKWF